MDQTTQQPTDEDVLEELKDVMVRRIDAEEKLMKLDLYGVIGDVNKNRLGRNFNARPRTEKVPSENDLPDGIGRWERRDKLPNRLRTTTKEGPPWEAVRKRMMFVKDVMVLEEEVTPENRYSEEFWHRPTPEEIWKYLLANGPELTTVLWYSVEAAVTLGMDRPSMNTP